MGKKMKNKLYYGVPPKNEAYLCVGSIEYQGNWDAYISSFVNESNKSWINFKLVFDGQRKHKANFWLAYNYDEHRFADNVCYRALVENYMDFMPKIVSFVYENKNCFNVAE